MTTISENELKHYGVLGMKWGRRRGINSAGISAHQKKIALKGMGYDPKTGDVHYISSNGKHKILKPTSITKDKKGNNVYGYAKKGAIKQAKSKVAASKVSKKKISEVQADESERKKIKAVKILLGAIVAVKVADIVIGTIMSKQISNQALKAATAGTWWR